MKQKFILILIFTLIITGGAAQNNQVLYFMNLPQNHLVNPALKPINPLYIGLPVITGIYVNETNNYFNFSDVFTEGVEISKSTLAFLDPDFDRDRFLGNLKKLNYAEPKASVQLLGLGFTAGDGFYFFLDIIDNTVVNLVAPRDYIRMAFLGNEQFKGQTIDLSDMRADFNYYREIGIGTSKNINPQLRFGAKAKLLFGLAGASFQNYNLKLTVNDDYTNTLDANMAIDVSGPVIFYTDSENNIEDAELDQNINAGKFLTNMSNTGFGLDLGAEYQVNDNVILSAAVTDIGFVKWKSDLSNLEAFDNNIELSGLDIEDIYEGRATIDDVYENMKDSLKNAFILAGTDKRFTSKLPVGLTLGGKYVLDDRFSFGLLSYSRFTGQQIKETVTLSANMNIGNKVSTTLAYSICNSNYSNLGLGIAFRASVAQFYFLCDRIPFSWKRAGVGSESFLLPSNWSTVHARIGINLIFGNKKLESEEIYR
jgi:hypothetical protein